MTKLLNNAEFVTQCVTAFCDYLRLSDLTSFFAIQLRSYLVNWEGLNESCLMTSLFISCHIYYPCTTSTPAVNWGQNNVYSKSSNPNHRLLTSMSFDSFARTEKFSGKWDNLLLFIKGGCDSQITLG